MTDQECFEAVRGILEGMAGAGLKYPTMPMGTYNQEAADLHAWAAQDQDKLVASGLDWSLVESLEQRIGASTYAQSIWRSLRFANAEAQKQYALESPAAYDLRDIIVHHMLFAYRKQSDILGRVQSIAEGVGDADMLQDLSDLAVLGRTYPEPLEKLKFDMNLLTKAETTRTALSSLLAVASGETSRDNIAKLNRDRAYTYLKEAVDEIREHGRYVFWRDEVRAKGYASEYVRRHRGQGGSSDTGGTAAGGSTTSSTTKTTPSAG